MFKNKKKSEQNLTDTSLTQRSEKKKESRKSVEKSQKKKTSIRDLEKLLDDHTIQAAGPILEEIVNSFHKEINYQNELLEYMKEESIFLKRKIQEETEKCANIMEQFELEMATLRKTTEEDRRERRQLQITLETLQATLSATPQSPPSSSTKTNPKPQNSKTKRPQKNKLQLNK